MSSLSLWHGAFDLGSDAAKTEHERNLAALLKLAAEDRAGAAAVRSLLCQRAASGVPADMAQLVLYPPCRWLPSRRRSVGVVSKSASWCWHPRSSRERPVRCRGVPRHAH